MVCTCCADPPTQSTLDFQNKCSEEAARLQRTTLDDLRATTAQRDDLRVQLRGSEDLLQQAEAQRAALERELLGLRSEKTSVTQQASSLSSELQSAFTRAR